MVARPRAPLEGINVIAIEHAVAAPLCTRHLADLGASVIKVERPGGDFAREYDHVVEGASAYFVWLNRGKSSVTINLQSADGRARLDDLLDTADVLVHNLGPGAIERLGYGWDHIHRRWPQLVACGISGYGDDGPMRDRKAFDLLVQAESGLVAVTGAVDQPAKVGISIADISAGMYALSSILSVLYARSVDGIGRRIDIAMLDCLAEWMSVPWYYERYAGAAPTRAGMMHNTIAPYGPYETSDGETVMVAVQTEPQWRSLCVEVLGWSDLAVDARFSDNARRVANRSDLEAAIAPALRSMTTEGLLAALARADVPFGRLNDVRGLLDHPQLQARDRWIEADLGEGSVLALEPPFNIAGHRVGRGSIPELT